MIISNVEIKEYNGNKKFYANVEGKRCLLKYFDESEIVEGADLDGYFKDWEFKGKTGTMFLKSKYTPKVEKSKDLAEILERLEKLNELLEVMRVRIDHLSDIIEKSGKKNEIPF